MKIISVGKIKEASLTKLINEYLKQIKDVKIIEVKDEKNKEGLKLESDRILKLINSDNYVVSLVIDGTPLDSIALANLIDNINTNIGKEIIFIIGGSYGLHSNVVKRSNYQLSLSKLTFPHQLTRLILVEQIYRSFMILKNHPYHK